ncbi:hypothetical protein [Wielerella bovis]|uniref:hypothetical protein n=1 Tax=Wielerella bovis TaxID=2917790 RepID=UPI0020196BC8|nr:hypothetical protein [Wielerella bovis]ULJ61011.1 hypothetical protein MIS44_03935 [Wielerella bovis]
MTTEQVTAINKQLLTLSDRYNAHNRRGELKQAQEVAYEVLALVPNHKLASIQVTMLEGRMGHNENAFKMAQDLLKTADLEKDSDDFIFQLFDTLAETCSKTHRYEAARWYASQAIHIRLKRYAKTGTPAHPITTPAFPLSENKAENIISYSLYGDKPRYCEVAVMNATLAKSIYPEWTCRFYVDDSVPPQIIKRLTQRGAQIINMQNSNLPGLFWRFMVADDANVKRFIVRDADSLISYKERAAVNEWIASGKHFHVIRDTYVHCELILAGMWGGCGGALGSMHAWINSFPETFTSDSRNIDQQFLRRHLWQTVAQSVFIHDFNHATPDSHPFPLNYPISDIELIPNFHIGMIDAHRTTRITIDDENAARIEWFLLDQHNEIVCQYEADVAENGEIALILPSSYTQKIANKEWHITARTLVKKEKQQ